MKSWLLKNQGPVLIVLLTLAAIAAAETITCDWQAAFTAGAGVAALATAVIVYWYTVETQRLREVAQEQLEGQVAPFLLLEFGYRYEGPPLPYLYVTDYSRTHNFTCISPRNIGPGPALRGQLEITTVPQWAIEGKAERAKEETRTRTCPLPPIPAGEFREIRIERADLFTSALIPGAEGEFRIKIRAEYGSVSGQHYVSRVTILGKDPKGNWEQDPYSVHYERINARTIPSTLAEYLRLRDRLTKA